MTKLLHTNYNGENLSFVIDKIVGIGSRKEQETLLHAIDGETYILSEPYEVVCKKLETCLEEK